MTVLFVRGVWTARKESKPRHISEAFRQRLARSPHQSLTVLHWIAFDDQTAAGIDQHIGPGMAKVERGDALSFALSLTTASIVVLPSSTPGKLVLATIRKTPPKATLVDAPMSFQPSGFLGLSDAPVFLDDSPPPAKRKWWQRKKPA
jgi:hypothetical protein